MGWNGSLSPRHEVTCRRTRGLQPVHPPFYFPRWYVKRFYLLKNQSRRLFTAAGFWRPCGGGRQPRSAEGPFIPTTEEHRKCPADRASDIELSHLNGNGGNEGREEAPRGFDVDGNLRCGGAAAGHPRAWKLCSFTSKNCSSFWSKCRAWLRSAVPTPSANAGGSTNSASTRGPSRPIHLRVRFPNLKCYQYVKIRSRPVGDPDVPRVQRVPNLRKQPGNVARRQKVVGRGSR